MRCEVEGTLDRVERVTQFTAFSVRASLQVPPGTDPERARGLLEKAEKACLISNSLKAQSHLEANVEVSRLEPTARRVIPSRQVRMPGASWPLAATYSR